MLLSIIVPIYNVEDYLKKCIESVLEQDISNYELMLIDDCSTDYSLSIAKQYENMNNVRIIEKKKNSGLSETRNIGLKEAKGEYILFLDSDDYVERGALGTIQSIICAQNGPEVIYFGFYEENEGTAKKKYGYKSMKNHLYSGTEFTKWELAQRNLYAAACFGVYKREFLIANNLFFKVGIFHEDELWTPRVVMKANKVYTSDYAYYHYVRRKNSITRKGDKSQNGIDLINSCKELDCLLVQIDDRELYKLMNNHIAMLYMKAMSEGKLYQKKYVGLINRSYPLKKTCYFKDKMKSILFAFSLRLYCFASNIK
ncbi:glycosyltransferase [Clostridium boliviensis]|uniref:Glycosyltransferase n=1 Tax=Clostridium boliviensis TaxID=318465 RepID=A0ABU4GQ52_9CLOT|nr:glycosyltransferase [Clostridium boliviensis]MDW2799766.1 glycosyltransferase [Clostridium boliviensis]